MAITITVEDGSVVADANSYVDLAYIRAFSLERGTDHSATPDDALAAGLINAMDLLESKAEDFSGERKSDLQELEWPRVGYFRSGASIDSTVIPNAVKKCQAQLALESLSANLQPNKTASDKGQVLSESVAGTVSKSYAQTTVASGIGQFPKAMNFLKPVLKNVPGKLSRV